MRSLVFLLKTQRGQKTFFIQGNKYTRRACLQTLIDQFGWSHLTPEELDQNLDLFDQAWEALIKQIIAQTPEANRPTKAELDYWRSLMNQAKQVKRDRNLLEIPSAEKLTVSQMINLIQAQRLWETDLSTQDRVRNTEAFTESLIESAVEELPPDLKKPLSPEESKIAAENVVEKNKETAYGSTFLSDPETETAVKNQISSILQSPNIVELTKAVPERKEKLLREDGAPTAQKLQQKIIESTGVSAGRALRIRIEYEKSLSQGAPVQTALLQALDSLSLNKQEAEQIFKQLIQEARAYRAGKLSADEFMGKIAETDAYKPTENAARTYALFEEALQKGKGKVTTQAALEKAINGLLPSQEEIEQTYQNLKEPAQAYAQAQKYLRLEPIGHPNPRPIPSKEAFYQTLNQVNASSVQAGGPAVSEQTYRLYCQGLTAQEYQQKVIRAGIDAGIETDRSPQIKAELEALSFLENNQVEKASISRLDFPPDSYQLNFARESTGYLSFLKQKARFLNQQVGRLAPGLGGWLAKPSLKWQSALANFTLKHPAFAGFTSFLSSPKQFVKTKAAGFLVNKGLRWAGEKGLKGLAGKGLLKLGTALAGKGLGKLVGGGVGSLIPVPVLGTLIGAAVGAIIDFVASKVINKAAGFLKKHGKKILGAAAGLLLLPLLALIGFIGKIAALLPALSTGLGILLLGTPYAPLGMLLTGFGIAGLGKQLIGALGKGGLGGTLSGLGTGIGNALGLGTTAAIPSYIMLAPAAALGAVAMGSFLYHMNLNTAFVLPPAKGISEGKMEPGLVVANPQTHLAGQIADNVLQNYQGEVTANNIGFVVIDLYKKGLISQESALELIDHFEQFEYLQCVTFKRVVEKENGINLPSQNAVAFLYNHPGCQEVSKEEAAVGDNALWGPGKDCPYTDPAQANKECSDNISCCGHIGIITQVVGNEGVYVTSANTNYFGSVDTRLFSKENITKIIRCE